MQSTLIESKSDLAACAAKSVENVDGSQKDVMQSLVRELSAGSSKNKHKPVPVNDDKGPDDYRGLEHNVPRVEFIPAVYDAQKLTGISNSNGVHRLVRLKPLHKKILALHLSGASNVQISIELNRSPCWISDVIKDPLCQEVIEKIDILHEEEFKRLRGLANETLRSAMQPGKPDLTRLSAAKTYYQRESKTDDSKADTAEDVMSKILTKIEAENIQINIIGSI